MARIKGPETSMRNLQNGEPEDPPSCEQIAFGAGAFREVNSVLGKILLLLLVSTAFGQNWHLSTTTGKTYRECNTVRLEDSKLYITQEGKIDGRYWNVTLSSGQEFRNVTLNGLKGDSLEFIFDSSPYRIPLQSIFSVKPSVRFGIREGLHAAMKIVPYVAGMWVPAKLSQLPLMSPTSAGGTFPIVLGLTIGTLGIDQLAKQLVKNPPIIEFHMYEMTPLQKLRAAQEILKMSNEALSSDHNQISVRSLPVYDIKEIQFSNTRRVGFAGIRHSGNPVMVSLAGVLFGGGSGFFLGMSSVSGCQGVECYKLKRNSVVMFGGLGALLGYLGGKERDQLTVYYLSHMTAWERAKIVRQLVETRNMTREQDLSNATLPPEDER